jgi:hypothetical protein
MDMGKLIQKHGQEQSNFKLAGKILTIRQFDNTTNGKDVIGQVMESSSLRGNVYHYSSTNSFKKRKT